MKYCKKIILAACTLLVMVGMLSCNKYLDRPSAAGVSEKDVYSTFRSFQGFTEELYSCLPDMSKPTWNGEWNTGDDILSTSSATYRMNAEFDNGNYRSWQTGGVGWRNCWLDGLGVFTDPTVNFADGGTKGLWPLSWYGIRKCNLGLANLDKMVNATEEERNVIRGQLLFFRGFFHSQLMSFWGGLPYIDTVLSSSVKLELPRLSYRETALRAAKDLEDAAALLPANWDNTTVDGGALATSKNNQQRVTKSAALAIKGKTLLYAASPMENFQSTGKNGYDADLCKQAADAFTRMLKLSDAGEARFGLLPWANYSENWYTVSSYGKHPGGNEVVFGPPTYASWQTRYSLVNMFIPPPLGGEAAISSPAANYVKYFGMANGLPLDAAGSGYDPADPWSNRDPRFYKDITYDGVQMFQGTAPSNEKAQYRFANLYTGGNLRIDASASRTGYLERKFVTAKCNDVDNEWGSLNIVIPYIRMADVYLMYAEAVLQGYGTPQSSHSGYLTAEAALNKVRNRATLPNIDARYTGSKDAFMGELMRERAVELAFEGLRWHDLRRWGVAGETKYKEKTAIDFTRGANGKPINMVERVVTTRVFENKHNWLPLPTNQVNLYPGFGQNPGW
jgi:starch-binding outer membrane protein, SusD/RagB family